MVKTLHARAATSEKDFEGYEEESEPNMRFSHALIVVLVLHVLAVGGVFAFNSLKGRHAAPDRAKPAAAAKAASSPDVVTGPGKKTAAPAREAAAPLPAAQSKTPAKSQSEADTSTYTVVPGDTLKRIATSHKTSVEAIEQANAIDGKSVLHVGQALKIPAKSNAAKTPAKPETAAAKAAEAKPLPAAKATEAKPSAAAKTSETKAAAPAAKVSDVKPAAPAAKNPEVKTAAAAKTAEPATAPKPAAGEPSKADKKPDASDKTYTVAKGDNPYAIAKKLKVSYNELIKANDIKDPTKLQIGQKLIVP
jgi:LysM repeat protein